MNGKLIHKILVAELDVMTVPVVLKQGRKMKAIKIRTDHFERMGMKQRFRREFLLKTSLWCSSTTQRLKERASSGRQE